MKGDKQVQPKVINKQINIAKSNVFPASLSCYTDYTENSVEPVYSVNQGLC